MADVSTLADPIASQELEIRRILLVDDDLELAATLKALLESRNYVVTMVNNGVEGLREAMSMDFDVILCDMMMPELPGDMFFRAVQAAKPHLCRRFVFITAHSGNPNVAKFIEKVDGLVLFKPVGIGDLIGMISLALKRGQHASAA
jgi:CheY-like chemotaxis protein